MKTTTAPIDSTSAQHSSVPFFGKGGGGTVLQSKQAHTPFFGPSLMQRKAAIGSETAKSAPTANGGGLPQGLRSGIESLSGLPMGDVNVTYNSHKPAQINALAYAQGTDIQLAPGQEQHLPHEAWHVVQQKQGRVSAGTQLKGNAINNDSALEAEADFMGAKAAAYTPTGGEPVAPVNGTDTITAGTVQMKQVPTHMGTFEDETYTDNGKDNVVIVLKFIPGNNVNAEKIGFTQSARTPNKGAPFALEPQEDKRIIKAGTGKGYGIDRITSRNTPIYGSDSLGAGQDLKDTPQDNNTTVDPTNVTLDSAGGNATYQLGHHYNDGAPKAKDAKMYDDATGFSSANSAMEFETTVLALDGVQKGSYYGSVKWGYTVDAKGAFKKIDFDRVSMGVPSQNFLAPAAVWNTAKTRGTMVIKANGTSILGGDLKEKYKAAKGDEYTYKTSSKAGDQVYCFIEKTTDAGKNGYVKIEQIKDKEDGAEMVDLPIPIVMKTIKDVPLTSDIAGANKIVDLTKDTRVENTFCHISGKYEITVVDGPNTDQKGYVNGTDLANEK